jgi:cytochrome c
MSASGAELTTGSANWAVQPKVWFVVVKDRQGRFPQNPLWGDGWGWALFEATQPDRQTATDYRKDCLACHEPARGTDLVYVQGYPVLGVRRGASRPRTNTPVEKEVVDFASGSAVRGAVVFAGTCTLCHTLAPSVRKRGPSLGGIGASGQLPSGKPASPENILRQVNEGGDSMPAFAGRLTAAQKADVIAYLKARR